MRRKKVEKKVEKVEKKEKEKEKEKGKVNDTKSSVEARGAAAKRRRNWKFGLESRDKPRRGEKAAKRVKEEEDDDEEEELQVKSNERDTESPSTSDYNFSVGSCTVKLHRMAEVVTCTLCEGYLVDATTITDCLHTFCKSCLLKYFNDDETCCPTCGILIHQSHPAQYVSYDRTMQDVIFKIVPGLMLDEKDKRNTFLNSKKRAAGKNVEAEERRRQKALEDERTRGTNRCYDGKASDSHHRSDAQMVVELRPADGNLPLPSRPVLRCSEMTTVNTIKRYLAVSLWDEMSRYPEFDIYCNNELMGKDFSLRFIWLTKRRNVPKNQPLDLFYRVHDG